MKKIKLIISCAALMVAASGCSMFGPKTKTTPELPRDREYITVKTSVKSYSPEEIKKGIVKGDWAIESVYGKPAVGEEAPFIKFVPSEHRIYGNNGCNVINAEYSYNPNDSTIRFDKLASTMMMCQKEGLTDYEINTALGAAKYYTWRDENSNFYITFYDETRREVMVLMHQNFQFLNGVWRVAKIEDKTVNVEGMKLVIDVDEGKLHGNTGCNIINGNLEIDMNAVNSISFSSIAMTRAACHDSSMETALVVALEEASMARPVSGNEVVLYDSRMNPVLTLVRTTDR
ncbi:MAG: META domain-containing protein [Candidatus Amulumruptor caecigallinarius]|nr:META domain-containing protein [Candidatus Amulumruptor caecigallinarius]